MKLYTQNSTSMPYKQRKYGCDGSIMTGTLFEEQSAFLGVTLLWLVGLS
jgi:hypothetical protein